MVDRQPRGSKVLARAAGNLRHGCRFGFRLPGGTRRPPLGPFFKYSQIRGNLVDFFSVLLFFSAKNGAKELKNHKIQDWCKAENGKLEKR